MNRQKIILTIVVLALIGATAGVLGRAKAHQKLGEPGIKNRPQADGKNLELLLPETVPGFTSEIVTNAESALHVLPADSSYRVRLYKADDGFFSQLSVVLMGSDRSSIHRPEICMTGQGWTQDNASSKVDTIHLDRPVPYDLPINKFVYNQQFKTKEGQLQNVSALYVFWFVDGDNFTANRFQWMMWWLPRDLVLKGVLQRWAYISFYAPCNPGQEEATYARLKKLIAATVPEFQLVPHAGK